MSQSQHALPDILKIITNVKRYLFTFHSIIIVGLLRFVVGTGGKEKAGWCKRNIECGFINEFPSCCSAPVLVCQTRRNKILQTGWLQQQKRTFS